MKVINTFALDGSRGQEVEVSTLEQIARAVKRFRRTRDGWGPVLHGTKAELDMVGAYISGAGELLIDLKLDGGNVICFLEQ